LTSPLLNILQVYFVSLDLHTHLVPQLLMVKRGYIEERREEKGGDI
jgi:hypothetical protein